MMNSRVIQTSIRAMSTRPPFRVPKPRPGQPLQPTTPASTQSQSPSKSKTSTPSYPSTPTHFRVTLHRSAIGLPERISRTLEALGIHKRMQTVYHPHSPEIAGKILKVKELVQVANVTADQVRTPAQARVERKAVRGYEVVSRRNGREHVTFAQAVHAARSLKKSKLASLSS